MTKALIKQEKQRFSLRKYSFGAASVLIGATLVFGGQVSADETVPVSTNSQARTVTPSVDANLLTKNDATEPAATNSATETVDVATQTDALPDATTTSSLDSTSVSESQTVEASSTEPDHTTTSVAESSVSPAPAALRASSLPTSGNYTYTERTEIKNQASLAAPTQFYANAGDKVYYDQTLTADGYDWLSYKSYSGMRRYARLAPSIQVAKPTPAPQAPAVVSTKNTLPSQGHYTFTTETAVKNQATQSAPVQFVFTTGDKVFYDKVLENDGHHWLSYVSYSGTRRYADLGASQTESPKAPQTKETPAPQATPINMPSQGQYQFSHKVAVKNAPRLSAQTEFTFDKGESVRYDQVLDVDNHHWISYVSYSGTRRYIPISASASTTPNTQTVRTGTLTVQDRASGDFLVTVSDVSDSRGIKAVKVPIWTTRGDQDDLVWYDGVKQADGSYQVAVSLKDHNNERGAYNIHLYYVEADGQMAGVTTALHQVSQQPTTSQEIPRYDLPAQGSYTFTKETAVKNQASLAAPTQFTFIQGDKVNYDQVLQADGYQWISYVSYSGTRRYAPVTTLTTARPKPKPETKQEAVAGQLTISNSSSQGFDVTVSHVSSPQEITAVHVPVWSNKGGQDDIIWYRAVKQTDGTYKTRVKTSDHHSDLGDYHVHLYYRLATGQEVGVAATKATLAAKQTPLTSGTLTITNSSSQGFEVLITDVTNANGVAAVKVPIWSDKGGQDDLVWYDAIKQANGDYKVDVKISDHGQSRGDYHVHLYYVEANGYLKGVTGTQTVVPEPEAGSHKGVTFNGSYYSVQGKYDTIVIANKRYPLAASYNPGENAQAKAAFVQLRNEMIAQGYHVGNAYSGFRPYTAQQALYQSYVMRDGKAAADRYSARAGYSEHQTGLAFDLTDASGNLLEDRAAAKWLQANAHRYGFVVRYQAGKESVTGYMPEAWHVRYIGREAADVYASGLTLEEYFGFEGGDYRSPARPNTTSSVSSNLPSQGTYTFSQRASIKAAPSLTSPELAYYEAGNRVYYDRLIISEGHQWLSYIGFSGTRRYIAID